jgi:outer membrane lipoprotein carrier protein
MLVRRDPIKKVLLAASGVLALAVATRADTPPIDQIVRDVQARIDATRDLKASVHQELVVASAGRTLEADGTVAYKRPGKMLWKLNNEEEQVIVADGSTLWFYQPEERQVLKAPFEAAFHSTTPISFLTGVGRIKDDFEVSLVGEKDGTLLLALVPRKRENDLGRLVLTVEKGSYDIVGAEVRDPLGNVTRLQFSKLERNSGLPDSYFHFEVPPGVDVIEAPIGH